MFIHDIAKWIMKYDYTSKITAALNARDLREQHDAHEHLYTPDTLNTGMRIKSRVDSNHHRCRYRHRYHRGASLIFPNAERSRRGSKSPFNDRASKIVNSLRSEAVHHGCLAVRFSRAERIRDYYRLCGVRAKRGRLTAENTGALSPRNCDHNM